MNNLVCPKCKTNYDLSRKLPRLFPNCGHTFCSECLLKMLKRKKNKFCCPRDNVKCDAIVFERGLDYFPINFAIKNLIYPQKDSDSEKLSGIEDDYSNSEQEDDQIQITTQQQTNSVIVNKEKKCPQHNKIIELVCLTDLKIICSECVMFGVHKNHDYLKFDYFKQRALKDLFDMKEKSENLNSSQLTKQLIEKEKVHLKQKVDSKKDTLTAEVKESFKLLRDTLKQKEQLILDSINKHFFKFDNSITQIHKNLQQIHQDEIDLKRQFFNLEEELQNKTPDYESVLPKLYSNDENLLQICKDINYKRNQQSKMTKSQIHDNLNKLSISGNTKQIMEDIQNSLNFNIAQANEKNNGSVDLTQSFVKKRQHIRQGSIDININDSTFQKRETIGMKKLDSMISDIVNKDSDEVSLNIEDDMKKNNILQDSLISPYKVIQSYKDVNALNNFENYVTHNNYQHLNREQTQQSRRRLSTQFNSGNTDIRNRKTIDFKQKRGTNYFKQNTLAMTSTNFNQSGIGLQTDKNNLRNEYKKVRSYTPIYSKMGSQSQTNFYQPQTSGVNKKDFSKKGISENDLEIYISDVMEDQSVQILDLSFNSITSKGFKQLIQGLSNHKCLEYINLSNNCIDEKAVIILEKFGQKMKSVKRVNLQNNKITNSLSKKSIYMEKLKKKGVKIHLVL